MKKLSLKSLLSAVLAGISLEHPPLRCSPRMPHLRRRSRLVCKGVA